MEGAKAKKVGPSFLKVHEIPDHILYVSAFEYLVDGFRLDHLKGRR